MECPNCAAGAHDLCVMWGCTCACLHGALKEAMPLSATDKMLTERIEEDFTYHAPTGDQPERYQKIRDQAKALARLLVELCPDRRERSLALTKLEECVMWANAGIARAPYASGSSTGQAVPSVPK